MKQWTSFSKVAPLYGNNLHYNIEDILVYYCFTKKRIIEFDVPESIAHVITPVPSEDPARIKEISKMEDFSKVLDLYYKSLTPKITS